MKVVFSHGQESGPWGSKISKLADIARQKGFEVDSIDYTAIPDPDQRVTHLLNTIGDEQEIILVGSSMGGYVSLVASEQLDCKAIFLLAPALYIAGYQNHQYQTRCPHISIIHGWSDDVIVPEHSIKFAKQAQCSLHLIKGDHRLKSSINHVVGIFEQFLQTVIEQ
ncbi:MAG: pimeloyl-ACP methyl ester carboxylesterase [Phenylobacterium sp.]|jgi:pimeloyl-ACP methyl ester carboxylesterase